MPDYNPAVAAGIKPPENDFANTLGTIANLQEKQALTGYYTLQGLQQQRQYEGLMAAADAWRRGEDPVAAGAAHGLNPDMLNQFQQMQANRQFMAAHGGMMPQGLEASASASANFARAANEKAQYPGFVAQSRQRDIEADQAQKNDAAQAASSYFASGDRSAVIAHAMKYHDNPSGIEIANLANLPKDQFDKVAASALGGGLTAAQATEPVKAQNAEGAETTTNRVNLLSGGPIVGQTKEAAAGAEKRGGYYGNLSSGIAAAGNTAANAADEIRIAKSVINDPGFYSGSGEAVNLAYKRWLSAMNIDPMGALPQEVFRKVMAQNIQAQVVGLKEAQEQMGAVGGRIFQAQIELMEKAAQNPDSTVAGNRFLTTLAERSATRAQKIADMAAAYKGGKLDAGFEKQMRDYVNKNPLFTDQELKFPKIIGMDDQEKQFLRDHPETAPIFDKHYGNGASKSVISP